MGDVQAVRQYEQFHFLGDDSATTLDPVSRVDHKFLLDGVHAALLAVHEKQLKALGQVSTGIGRQRAEHQRRAPARGAPA